MQPIRIGRYDPPAAGFAGFIEPADRSWITFVAVDGSTSHFSERDPETGAVIVPTPDSVEAQAPDGPEPDGA